MSINPTPELCRGYTVADLAARLRVSPDKIRGWITSGQLAALNTRSVVCGRPRWVVTPDALAAFEQRRASGAPTKPTRRRRRQDAVDYYP
jgi:hypothetical protein